MDLGPAILFKFPLASERRGESMRAREAVEAHDPRSPTGVHGCPTHCPLGSSIRFWLMGRCGPEKRMIPGSPTGLNARFTPQILLLRATRRGGSMPAVA